MATTSQTQVIGQWYCATKTAPFTRLTFLKNHQLLIELSPTDYIEGSYTFLNTDFLQLVYTDKNELVIIEAPILELSHEKLKLDIEDGEKTLSLHRV